LRAVRGYCDDVTSEVRVVGIGIAQGDDDIAVGVSGDHA